MNMKKDNPKTLAETAEQFQIAVKQFQKAVLLYVEGKDFSALKKSFSFFGQGNNSKAKTTTKDDK